MKLSKHGKIRLRERTPLNHKERAILINNILSKGKSPEAIKDEKTKQFLKSKERWNSKVKLYNNYVFIYSKNNKRLYTMYKLPEEFIKD